MTWLLVNSLLAAAGAVLVLAIQHYLRPRPAFSHALWLLVLARLVVPPLWSVTLPVPAPQELTAASPGRAPPVVSLPVAQPVAPAPGTGYREPAPGPAPSPFPWEPLLYCTWACGALLWAGRTAQHLVSTHRLIATGTEPPPALGAAVAHTAAHLGVRQPRTVLVAGIRSPFVWAVGRTTLVLPESFKDRGPGSAAILAHELAHLRRRDHWCAWAETLLAPVFFWHPLFWWLRARVRENAELACDAWALWTEPDTQNDYAQALLDAVSRRHTTPAALPALGAGSAAGRFFERRLKMILNQKTPRRLSPWAAAPLAALLLAATAAPTFAQEERSSRTRLRERTERQEPQDPELRALLRQVRNLKRQIEQLERQLERQERGEIAIERNRGRREERERRGWRALDPDFPRAIEEARQEIRSDRDLHKFGIAEDVEKLLESVLSGEGEVDIGPLVHKAMRGILPEIRKELRNDPDLKKLGIAEDVEKLVESLMKGDNAPFEASLERVIKKAMKGAMAEVRTGLRNDPGLRELGIGKDIEKLVEGLLEGNSALHKMLERQLKGALKQVQKELGEGGLEARIEREIRQAMKEVERARKEMERAVKRDR